MVTANASSTSEVAIYRFDDISVTSTQVGIEEFGVRDLTWGSSLTGDRIWVSVNGSWENDGYISLYDLDGRMVPITTQRCGEDRYEIIPTSSVAGLYLLSVSSGAQRRVAKVIFQPY
ncbi:MAG: T9SS type A sorting domain-containing protein [Flavobacteriales bacterium]